MKRTVFFVSDRTGITAKTLGASLLSQFPGVVLTRVSLPYVDTVEKAGAAARRIDAAGRADGVSPLVFSTLVDAESRMVLAGAEATLFDFFETFVGPLEYALGAPSSQAVGRTHGMGEPGEYQVRMDAVNYALNVDDGVQTGRLEQADFILLGVSRSGKTPTCLYLAMEFGIHAANYPLTAEDFELGGLPPPVRPYRGRLFGLTILPERLHQIREQRRAGSAYASLGECRFEVRQAEQLFRRERIPFVNTTQMSVEEIATTLMHEHGLQPRVLR
jgi:regulator of PEP synthase PpsR (kinase-PPPase family)